MENKVPTLCLFGQNDKVFAAQEAIERLNKVAPHIQSELVLRAGHDLSFVHAEMVSEKVLGFLK